MPLLARLEAVALLEQGCPLIQSSGLVIEWRPDMTIDDDAYDPDFLPPISLSILTPPRRSVSGIVLL